MDQPGSATGNTTTAKPVTKEYVQRIMRDYENNNTYMVKSISTSGAVRKGDNHVAEVFRIKITGSKHENGELINIHRAIIVKTPKEDFKNVPPCIFKYESKFYNYVLGPLEEAYGARLPVLRCIKGENHLIVLEDYQDGGWVLTERREGNTTEEMHKLFRSLAKLHCASIVLKSRDEARFNRLCENLQDQVFSPSNEPLCRKTLADAFMVSNHNAVRHLPTREPMEKERLRRFFTFSSDHLYDLSKKVVNRTEEEGKVIAHADCWANNFMVKEDKTGDHALLINLATACKASPARDLLYIFQTNCKAMDKHELVKFYVQQLQRELTEHQVPEDTIKFFSVRFIESELKRLEVFGRLIALWLLIPMSFITFPTLEEYNATSALLKPELLSFHLDNAFYLRRLSEIFLEFSKKRQLGTL